MVDFQDPTVVTPDLLIVTKFWNLLGGLYFWEFITTIDYEWSVIQRRRPRAYRWTIGVYSVTRIATLMAVILSMFGLDVTAQYNCQVETTLQYIAGYLAFASASFLIVLRIIAIWNRNKFAIVLASGVWVTNVALLIQSVVRIRAVWVPEISTCVISNVYSTRLNMISVFITDLALLLIMLVGLLRLGVHKSGKHDLVHFMWRQGLIWLFIATIAEVPPVGCVADSKYVPPPVIMIMTSLSQVFISLNMNLNDPFNYMFQIFAMITMTIAATRIYRSLADFSSKFTDFVSVHDNFPPTGPTAAKRIQAPAPSAQPETMEVVVHNIPEQYQTPHSLAGKDYCMTN